MPRDRTPVWLRAALGLFIFVALLPLSSAVSAQDDPYVRAGPEAAAPAPVLPPSNTPPPNTGAPSFLLDLLADNSAGPDETITLHGGGWLSGELLSAMLYEPGAIGDPTGFLADSFAADAYGGFHIQVNVPYKLFGADGTGFYAVPGEYEILVRSDRRVAALAPFTVGAPRQGALIWGQIALDGRDSISIDDAEVAGAVAIGLGVELTATGTTPDSEPIRSVTDALGRYLFWVPAGVYMIHTETDFQGMTWGTSVAVAAEEQEVLRTELVLHPGA